MYLLSALHGHGTSSAPSASGAPNECGRFSSESRSRAPASISVWASWSNSSSDPSHQWMSSGWVSPATSSTHSRRRAWLVVASRCGVVLAIYAALLETSVASGRLPGTDSGKLSYGEQRFVQGQLLDVGLGLVERAPWLLPRNEHQTLEFGHQHAVLVEHPGVNPNRT